VPFIVFKSSVSVAEWFNSEVNLFIAGGGQEAVSCDDAVRPGDFSRSYSVGRVWKLV